MATLVHMAQEYEGFHCGVEVCPERARLFACSYKKRLRQNVLSNNKIAYIWSDVKKFDILDFNLIYTFDKTMPPDAWYHMMESFCQSPRCKFLISSRTLKVKPGNTEAFQSILEDYDLHFLHDILVYMKCSNKACHAGFHIRQSVKDGKPAAINHLSHQEINPIWSDCHNFWSSQELAFKSLDEIIVRIDEHQKI